MKTSDALEALAFAYGYGLGGLEPCPDDQVPGDVVREWLSELIRKEREEAWDEGFQGCAEWYEIHHWQHTEAFEDNPYRKEQP